ncbi:MAG: energy-coupling factor transporter ATPase [Anaerotignum sp.]|nr:energy-coupling factor transporter ATPase [Anaerotignum sp.]
MSIKINHLTHIYNEGTTFEKLAINDISLEIETGEFIGLIGHTGSGKSTLIQHLNGIVLPTKGEILLDGENIHRDKTKLKEVRRRIGLAFQYPEYQLFEMTVYKDVAFGPTNIGLSPEEVHDSVVSALTTVGISSDLYEKSPFELSGGQKRRVAIAGVLAMNPEVLILDEPTAGLDPKGRDEILAAIRQLHKERGITVILVSHSMEDVAKLADRIIVMHRGKIAMMGTPSEVFSKPMELETIGLAAPQISYVFAQLKEKGYDVPTDVYTVGYAKDALLKLVKQVRA